MSSVENNPWQGPFESLEAFEAFQDQSIAGLADFALNSPRHISDAEVLKDQLWSLGKILPAAILGLGRYNPATTELDISEEKRLTLTGRTAYERMVGAWHNVDNLPRTHRFKVDAMYESTYTLEVAHVKDTCLLIGGQAKTEQGPFLWECISISDTSRIADADKDSHPMAASVTNALYSQSAAPVAFAASPFCESKSTSTSGYGDLTEENVALVAGQAASNVLRRDGETGLYHHLLRTTMRKLVAGVDLGPVRLQ